MRNATAILFILCANIVLLAHAVIPHHHHDEVACFEVITTEKHDHGHCCDHQDAGHQEKHDAGTSNDCCVLNDFMAIIPDNFKQEIKPLNFSFEAKNFNHFLLAVIPAGDELLLSGLTDSFRQNPIPDKCLPAAGSLGPGLRGPPSC